MALIDKFQRKIDYLRISITDKCNLRCQYCMPEDGVNLLKHEDIISFEEIAKVVETSAKYGIDKIRITGGEPLVRRGITDLIRMIASVDGIKDLAMTTNGFLLEKYIEQLHDAGLRRLTVSLDTLNPTRFKELTSRDLEISQVLRGLEKTSELGFKSIKLNTVR